MGRLEYGKVEKLVIEVLCYQFEEQLGKCLEKDVYIRSEELLFFVANLMQQSIEGFEEKCLIDQMVVFWL